VRHARAGLDQGQVIVLQPRFCLLVLVPLLLAGQDSAADPSSSRIYLLPVGNPPALDLTAVEGALTAFYKVEVKRLPGIALPRKAYYKPRNRYRADKLLDHVESLDLPQDGRSILAVTAAPISITKGKAYDWGIIGYVSIGGEICAYSTYYVKLGLKDPARVRERIGKIAVHEFTHNLGLGHCAIRGCIMEDARGTPLIFDRVYDFCSACRGKVAKAGWSFKTPTVIPWPRPAKNAGPSDAYLKRIRRLWE
jgi:archaemetzincin